jgi:rhodanese-related sulfurtransferase
MIRVIAFAAVTLAAVGFVALAANAPEQQLPKRTLVETAPAPATRTPITSAGDPRADAIAHKPISVARAPVTVALPDDRYHQPRADLAEGRAVLLDVREQQTWDDGSIEGAVSFPWSWLREYDSADELNTIPTDKIVYIYGDASGNARLAAALLTELGFDARAFEHSFTELAKRFDTGG